MNFHERKAKRKEYYLKYEYKWKQQRCTACAGSGYYDHNGSPPCGSCEGTGKERVSPENYKAMQEYREEWLNRNKV